MAYDELAHRDQWEARQRHRATQTGVLQLSSDVGAFLRDLSLSEDIWVVQFIVKDCLDCSGLARTWQDTAALLHGIASVGVVDVTTSKNGGEKNEIDDAWSKFGISSVPFIAIFDGGQREPRRHVHFLEEDTLELANGKRYISLDGPDMKPQEIAGHVEMEYIFQSLDGDRQIGSVLDLTARAKRLRQRAMQYVKRAYELRPNHPHAYVLGARLLGPGLKLFDASNDLMLKYAEYLDEIIEVDKLKLIIIQNDYYFP